MASTDERMTGRWTFYTVLMVAGWVCLLISGLFAEGVALLTDPFAAIFLLPGLVFIIVGLWRPRAWAHLTAGILVSLPAIVILFLFGAVLSLNHPERGNDFVSTVFVLLTLLLALPAGIASFRASRKQAPQPELRSAWRTRMGTYVIVVGLVALGSVVTSLVGSAASGTTVGGGYDFTPTESVSIVTEEFEFVPKDFSIKAGVITEIVVENRDSAFHTFTYELDGKTYNHDLVGGKTATFLVRVDGPQTIKFWCEPHQPDMAGELAVQ